jgi:Holliday junction DNA helicase RuvA subunit
MIGKLKGTVDSYGEDFIILDVHGVGYVVHCSARTLQALPAPGEAATLAIETYVREDQIRLFGFLSDAEREWFRLLQTVQGVGARVALSVLGTLRPAELASAIAIGDKAAIKRAPGVGTKVAERLVVELRTRPRPIRLSTRRRSSCPARLPRSERRSRCWTRFRHWSISAMASRRRPPRLPPRARARERARRRRN